MNRISTNNNTPIPQRVAKWSYRSSLNKKLIVITAHIIGWLLLCGLLFGFVLISQRSVSTNTITDIPPSVILFLTGCILIFYTNANVLVPQLYLRKHYVLYFGIFLLVLAAVYLLRPFEQMMDQQLRRFRPPEMPPFPFPAPPGQFPANMPPIPGRPPAQRTDIISIILLVMVWSLSFGIEILREWRRTERRAVQAEADKANAELSFLKAQINPHFLFNTLNNIYALAVRNDEQTAPAIMKLSHIMRFISDNAAREEVPLQQAVGCMTDLIDLNRLRFNNKVNIEYNVTGKFEGKYISAFVLITFVENIFKWGISSHEPSPVIIRLHADDNAIHFFCQNKIFHQNDGGNDSGIGLENTRKRLAFLYPGKHRLQISTANKLFTVDLEIWT